MDLVAIGKVVRAIGLGGWIGVAGSDGTLAKLSRVALRREPGQPAMWPIREARPQGKLWAVRLDGVADRLAAEALVGCEVLAERGEIGVAGKDQHFWSDLKGLPVSTTGGVVVGRVTGLYQTGAVDVLAVTRPGGGEVLIPLAPYVEVDVEGGRVVIDPPDGLLELGGPEKAGGDPERGS